MKDEKTVDLGALGTASVATGYTGGEWASASPPSTSAWTEPMLAAHAKWGGGKELSYAELEEFLDLIFRTQDLATEIGLEVQRQIPGGRDETAEGLVSTEAGSNLLDQEYVDHVHSWSVEALASADACNLVDVDQGPAFIRSSPAYTGSAPYRWVSRWGGEVTFCVTFSPRFVDPTTLSPTQYHHSSRARGAVPRGDVEVSLFRQHHH